MGFWGELVPLGVALCLTVSGTSAQCGEQQHKAFLDCVYPYLSSFVPLTMGSSCDRKLITAGLCTNFAIIVQCVNDINNSSTCMCDAVSPIREKIDFACDLNDLREACTEAPNQETGNGRINGGHAQTVSHVGDVIQTTTSSSKEDGDINGGRAHVFGNGSIPQCEEQEHTAFLDCVLPYFSSFIPLTMGSSCNRKFITTDLCSTFAAIVRCVNAIHTSSACRRDAVTQIREQMNFACNLNDLQETCTEAPTLDTGNGGISGGHAQTVSHVGDAIQTTTSSSKEDGDINGGRAHVFGNGSIPQCKDQEHTAFLGCVLSHFSSFLPLTMGSSCNRKLITADLCRTFASIVRCVNGIHTSSACRRDAVTQIKEQMNFACKLNDLQETCTQAPTLDTGNGRTNGRHSQTVGHVGDAIQTTTSLSKGDGGIKGGSYQTFGYGFIPQCEEQEHTAFLGCVLPYFSSFLPLTMGSFCNRKLITAGLCTKFATIVRCVNGIKASSACRRNAFLLTKEMDFACKLNDLQETCTQAPTLDTGLGEAIHSTKSSSKGGSQVTGSATVSRAPLVLLMIYDIILLALLLQIY